MSASSRSAAAEPSAAARSKCVAAWRYAFCCRNRLPSWYSSGLAQAALHAMQRKGRSARRMSARLEEVRERAAHFQLFRAVPKRDLPSARVVESHRGDRADVDDGAAMHLPEMLRVELARQLAERLLDEGLALRGHEPRVLGVRLEIEHLVDVDELERVPERCLQPLQAVGAGGDAARELFQQRVERRGGCCNAGLQAPDRLAEAFGGGGLQDIVDGATLEGLDGVAIVGGHEDDMREAGQGLRRLEAVQERHLDVEERDVGLHLARHVH